MTPPLVSVIIPAYNYCDFIGETLRSLVAQTYPYWEAIVVDDGSTDDTRRVVEQWVKRETRIRYFYQSNKGLPAARNAGLTQAKGSYIQFLDADDLLSPMKLALQVEQMESRPEISISYTRAFYFRGGKTEVLYAQLRGKGNSGVSFADGRGYVITALLVEKNLMPVNSVLMRSAVIQKVGLQNERLTSLEDWEFWLRCAFKGLYFAMLQDDQAYALIRVHQASMSQQSFRMYENEVSLRNLIDRFLLEPGMSIEEERQLRKKNEQQKLRLETFPLRRAGFLQLSYIGKLIRKIGFVSFLKVYFKALNDWRRGR